MMKIWGASVEDARRGRAFLFIRLLRYLRVLLPVLFGSFAIGGESVHPFDLA